MPNCGQTHLTSTTLAFQSDSVLLQGGKPLSENFARELWVEISDWPSGGSVFILNHRSSSLGPQRGPSFSFGRRCCKSNFPADGISPDTNATLEPWHFTSAECSLVIYYSFPVREAKTASEKNLLQSLECQQRAICVSDFCSKLCDLGQVCLLCPLLCGLVSNRELLIVSVVKISGILQVKALGTQCLIIANIISHSYYSHN